MCGVASFLCDTKTSYVDVVSAVADKLFGSSAYCLGSVDGEDDASADCACCVIGWTSPLTYWSDCVISGAASPVVDCVSVGVSGVEPTVCCADKCHSVARCGRLEVEGSTDYLSDVLGTFEKKLVCMVRMWSVIVESLTLAGCHESACSVSSEVWFEIGCHC